MSGGRRKSTLAEFVIVFDQVADLCVLEQIVTTVHFDPQGVHGMDHLAGIRHNGILGIRKAGQKVFFDAAEQR